VLLAIALLSFPWLHTMLVLGGGPVTGNGSDPKWVDNPFMLRILVADLKREGLFNPELFNVFIGDPGSRGPFLKKTGMDLMWPEYRKRLVDGNSVDFVLAADGMTDSSFRFVDRVLKVGGIVTVLLGSDPNRPFCLPSNYRVTYVRRFGSTVVAIKKISHDNADKFMGGLRSRRLLSVATKKKKKKRQPQKTMYLVKLMVNGDSFDGHWFEIDHAKKSGELDVVVVASVGGGVKERMAKWFERYAKGKEVMVAKAEAETKMEMKKKRIVRYLMDKIGLALYGNT